MAKAKKHAPRVAQKTPTSPFAQILKGLESLIGLVTNLEKEGKSEYKQERTVSGKTESGKPYRASYGVRVRTGLDAIREEEEKAKKSTPE